MSRFQSHPLAHQSQDQLETSPSAAEILVMQEICFMMLINQKDCYLC